jgi:hypothetical protein
MYFAIWVSQDKILRASPLTASILSAVPALMTIFIVLCLGLFVGVMVGLLGIGGGVVLVPALVYLLHYDQHLAQGTSLFILLPPIGLGARASTAPLAFCWAATLEDVSRSPCPLTNSAASLAVL